MVEKINFGGWPNCIRLYNEQFELVVTTDVGPRIVRLGFIEGQNFFYLSPEDAGKIGGDKWRIYGGHRLWIAPETIPGSYYPDNDAVKYDCSEQSIRLSHKEATTGIVKEIQINLGPGENGVTVAHRFRNEGNEPAELSLWALSVLAAGGRAIVPHEPYGEGDEFLLPSRSLALWHYTKMDDPRWIWGAQYIQARHDAALVSEQKIGVINKQQWAAYCLRGEVFIKHFPFDAHAKYPDFGCNNEVYINGNFLELETLGPTTHLSPGETMEHKEQWLVAKAEVTEDEDAINNNLLPLVRSFMAV